jgi:hypothetical protein
MVNLISQRSDNSLSGPAKWYTDFHVMTCPHCRTALKGLRLLNREVQKLATSLPGVEAKLTEADWHRIDEAIRNP